MRTLFIIIMVLRVFSLSAQQTLSSGDQIVFSGTMIKVQADDIPQPPEYPDPLPYADSIDILMDITFDDMNAIAYSSHHDSITQAFDYLNYVGAELDNYFQTLAIIDAGDGDMALESYYPEGECCTEEDDGTTGTGGLIRAAWDASDTGYDEVLVRIVCEFDEGFTVASGLKFPGVRFEGGAGSQRLMLKPGLYIMYYNYEYTDAADTSPGSTATYCGDIETDTITSGVEFTITQRFVIGTIDLDDGIHEVFINRNYIDSRTKLMFNNSVTTTKLINSLDFSSFMGGEGEEFDADHDEKMRVTRITAYKFKDGVTTVTTGINQSPTDTVLPRIFND